MTRTSWLPDGNGTTVADGTLITVANAGLQQGGTAGQVGSTSSTVSNAIHQLANGLNGKLAWRFKSAPGTANLNFARKVFPQAQASKAFSWHGTVFMPATPSNSANSANLGTLRTTAPGVAARFYETAANVLQLQDAVNLTANQLNLGTVTPGRWYWVEVWGTVGSSTSNSEVYAQAWDRLTGVPLTAQPLHSTAYNLGTTFISTMDAGVFYAVTNDAVEVLWTEVGFDDAAAASWGGPPTVQDRSNDAEGLTGGAQITTNAQSVVNQLSSLDVQYLNGCPLYVDTAHKTHGTNGFRLDLAANASGQVGMPMGGAQYARFRYTKYVSQLPTTTRRTHALGTTGGGRAHTGYMTSTGKLRFDTASATGSPSAGAVLVGQMLTVEGFVAAGSTTAGVLHVRAYKNNDPTALVHHVELDAADTTTSTLQALLIGRGVATADAESDWFDDVVVQTATTPFTDYLGPAGGGVSTTAGTFPPSAAVWDMDAQPGQFLAGSSVTGDPAVWDLDAIPGTFIGLRKLQGTVSGAVTAVGTVGGFRGRFAAAAGTVTATGTATGTAGRAAAATGTVTATGSASAASTVPATTSGTVTAVGTASGAVVAHPAAAAATVTAVGTVDGRVDRPAPPAAATVTAVGTAGPNIGQAATAPATVTATGTIGGQVTRPSAVAATVTAVGSAATPLTEGASSVAASVTAVGTVAASQGLSAAAVGQVTAVASASASVARPAAASAAVTATGSVTGSVSTSAAAQATVTATGTATSAGGSATAVSATVTAVGTVDAHVTTAGAVLGTVTAAGTVGTPTRAVPAAAAATVTAVGTASAGQTPPDTASGTVTAVGSVGGYAESQQAAQATVTAQGYAAGDLARIDAVMGTVTATATVQALTSMAAAAFGQVTAVTAIDVTIVSPPAVPHPTVRVYERDADDETLAHVFVVIGPREVPAVVDNFV